MINEKEITELLAKWIGYRLATKEELAEWGYDPDYELFVDSEANEFTFGPFEDANDALVVAEKALHPFETADLVISNDWSSCCVWKISWCDVITGAEHTVENESFATALTLACWEAVKARGDNP